ncbi:PEP-CTERM sorting domain-containing protein [Alteromonas sp. BL110]|uniref:PEP-CTERM sorting domain-containing protein n=1 Tax=Alteromonas sp. BL110 TaxID=1714845 RepID=UPI000E4E0DCB|nr:PEP-CTERM sorting domain-containing protein [Alteromonas sp. BL110]AXT39656.1 PEP-CTERM sorting domain-containing protein [Alteromonas sp. BL110]RKM81857.1 PEP-CTERM sorting domain-containing protein [Alteromonas sp. BL110]
MKKLLLATATAAGLALSGQAAATPFFLDLTDDSVVNPRGSIDTLELAYDSVTEVNTATGALVSRGGLGLIGYTFNGTNAGFDNLEALVLNDEGNFTNTFTYDPSPNNIGQDGSGYPTIIGTALTFDFELDGFLNADGDTVTYTGGVLDIYSYQYSYDFSTPEDVTILGNEELLIESEFVSSSINPGEQIIESLITEVSLTPAGQEVFYFQNSAGQYVSFQEYINATLTDILVYASQTVTVGDLANNIANPIDSDGPTVLVSDDHSIAVKFQVPEPSTVAVLGLGLIGMFGFSRRNKK